jgi:hypothetical protein
MGLDRAVNNQQVTTLYPGTSHAVAVGFAEKCRCRSLHHQLVEIKSTFKMIIGWRRETGGHKSRIDG